MVFVLSPQKNAPSRVRFLHLLFCVRIFFFICCKRVEKRCYANDKSDYDKYTEHTLRHYREFTRPALFSRVGVSAWKEAGCPTFEDRVLSRYRELSANPVRYQLSPDTSAALDAAFQNTISAVCIK